MKCRTGTCPQHTPFDNCCELYANPTIAICDRYTKTPTEKDPNGLSANTPGAKLDAGKIQASLLGLFARALLKVAEVGTHGAAKYSRGGWQFVEDGQTRYDDAQWRHLLKGYIEPLDPDSDLLHKAHKTWNALAELELLLRKTEK